MSTIDERGQRAGADLRRSAGHRAGPPLGELAGRRRERMQRTVAVGVIVAVLAGGLWSMARPDSVPDGVEVSSIGPAADTAANGEDDRPTTARNDLATQPVAAGGEAPSPAGATPGTTNPSASEPAAPVSSRTGGVRPPTNASETVTTVGPAATPAPSPSTSAPDVPDVPEVPEVPDPTPPTTPTTTTPITVPPVLGPPTGPSTPSSPAWAPACAVADELLQLAWAVDAGSSGDMAGVALLFIETVRAIPDGVAPAEVAYTEELIRSIEQYIRVAPLAGDFIRNADVLILAIGAGCGAPGGLPLPPTTVPRIYSLVFESGLF